MKIMHHKVQRLVYNYCGISSLLGEKWLIPQMIIRLLGCSLKKKKSGRFLTSRSKAKEIQDKSKA